MTYQPPAAQQYMEEFNQFLDLLKANNVKSYLEIGSKHGGALWLAANALPKGSLIVSVDLPWGKRETEPVLKECWMELQKLGYEVHGILGDSTSPNIIHTVKNLGPFDACFIDANHTLPYVKQDWENYGPLCKMVAFHDIGWIEPPNFKKMKIDVPILWNKIKQDYPHSEFKSDHRHNGIGVLWM